LRQPEQIFITGSEVFMEKSAALRN
jgi:hypothetical protein